VLLSNDNQLGAQWTHKESLQYATSFQAKGKLIINIRELQLIPKPSFSLVESFLVSPHNGEFSFSPASFHASFVTEVEVVVLDVRGSRILFHTKTTQSLYKPPGQFSPDGSFFACGTLEHKICIWRNTSTSYVSWSTLQPRLPFSKFSFSPTAISILAWSSEGIQLLHPENSINPLSPNKIKPLHQLGKHLVAYSRDRTHIATAQLKGSIITVLDPLLGTPVQSIHTGVQIQDIKIVGTTIFVADGHELISWNLEAGGGATVSDSYCIGAHMDEGDSLVLSNDCSQIAFAIGKEVFLYDIEVQGIFTGYTMDHPVILIQFSQDGCQLDVFCDPGDGYNFGPTELKMENWYSADVTQRFLSHKGSQIRHFQSPLGYFVGLWSEWIKDSRYSDILWLPPNWRRKSGLDMRWEGDFLALVGSHHQEPIIIEFQPQPLPPSPPLPPLPPPLPLPPSPSIPSSLPLYSSSLPPFLPSLLPLPLPFFYSPSFLPFYPSPYLYLPAPLHPPASQPSVALPPLTTSRLPD
jgi:hypothetical protein